MLRNWIQVGEPVLVSSNGFNLAASYSPQAKESNTFVDPVFDERFSAYRLVMFNEAEWDQAMQDLAIQSLKDDPGQVFRVIGRNTQQYFELDPSLNVNPESSDGRNLDFRDRTLWTFYVVTVVGLFGLIVRVRQPMVLLILAIAGYFTLSSLVLVAPPRCAPRSTSCCCIGVGLAVEWVLATDRGPTGIHSRRGRSDHAGRMSSVATVAAWLLFAAAGGRGGHHRREPPASAPRRPSPSPSSRRRRPCSRRPVSFPIIRRFPAPGW